MSAFTSTVPMRRPLEGQTLRAERSARSMLLRITSSLMSRENARGEAENVVEVVVRREREITRPATAVEDFDLAAEFGKVCVVESVRSCFKNSLICVNFARIDARTCPSAWRCP